MNKITEKYNQPGEYKVEILFDLVGEQKEWLGIVDARQAGNYVLEVAALHKAKETGGRITIRAVVGKGATLTVTGLIKIEKQAQNIDDFLEIRILLIDPTARATAEPRLEIEADEVKASHAASVGKIDEEQVLYLMSRGMSEEQAKSEIVDGFLGSVK